MTAGSAPRRMGVAVLYPELLFALIGHTGDAFVRDGGAIALADAVDWVTPPERCAGGVE